MLKHREGHRYLIV